MANTNEPRNNEVVFFNKLRQSFNTADHTDLTIKSYGEVWRVHTILVCPQSPFLAALCKGAASHDGAVTLDINENPNAIRAMLHYLYWEDYSDKLVGLDCKTIMLNLLVHELADKFTISGLAKLAAGKFRSRAKAWWASPAFAEAALRIFSAQTGGSNNELRAIVVGVVMAHEDDLLGNQGFGERLCAVVRATPALYKAIKVGQAIKAEQARRSAARKRRFEEMESETAIAILTAEEKVASEVASKAAVADLLAKDREEQAGKYYSCANPDCRSMESEGDILATTGFYHYCSSCHVGDEPDVWLGRPAKRVRT
ncbi:hypothetical protein LTR27_002042 [Elasticomyces elasticus]|nr:hypothetical protein LTR27_002042 [Elasticomyces elasticus]